MFCASLAASRARADNFVNGAGGSTGTIVTSLSTTKVGIGITSTSSSAVKNRLDVKGAAVIGSGFAGANTAPTDGLLVQGPIGVNTTSINSGMKLHVAGSAYVSGSLQADGGIKIKSNWSLEVPDYVFDQSRFSLPNLGDVERFVRANKHLPDVPSASELNQEGMDVAEMNLRLLKKVEELTLYVIEQDKRIQELSAKLDAGGGAGKNRGRR